MLVTNCSLVFRVLIHVTVVNIIRAPWLLKLVTVLPDPPSVFNQN